MTKLSAFPLLLATACLMAGGPAKDPLEGVAKFSGDPAKYWQDACARCHGPNGNGRKADGSQLPDAGFDFTDSRKANKKKDSDWVRITLKGKEKMPAFEKLMTEDDAKLFIPILRKFSAK
jgi:mono/diheme cytochrome c family protein